ncbi:MAG: hypothetical protein AAB697_01145 [Patescibacteria group bacterium]
MFETGKEESPILVRFGKYAQVWGLRIAAAVKLISEDAAARLAQEDVKGGRAERNASSANAAVMPASET